MIWAEKIFISVAVDVACCYGNHEKYDFRGYKDQKLSKSNLSVQINLLLGKEHSLKIWGGKTTHSPKYQTSKNLFWENWL